MDKLKRDITLYYIFSFFIGFYIANGTTVLFARELDLSFSRIFTLGAVYMLMFILFEIPTGAFADLVGRKKTLILGSLVLALAAVASGLSHNFFQLFLSFFIWALGFSLISGANEAILYDRLNDEALFAKTLGKSHFFWLFGTAAAGVLGPYLFSLNFRYPYLASAAPFALAGVAMMFFREHSLQKRGFSLSNHWQQIKTGTVLAFHNKYVLWSMAVLALCFAVAYSFSNSYQPYLQEIGFEVKYFSFILPVMFTIEALGGAFSGRVREFLREYRMFWLTLMGMGLNLGLLGLFGFKSSLIFLFAYTFGQGLIKPLISTYANRHIDSVNRATVVSVQSMIGTVAAAAVLFSFGFLTDKIGVVNLTAFMGGLMLLAVVLLMFIKPEDSPSLNLSRPSGTLPSSGESNKEGY